MIVDISLNELTGYKAYTKNCRQDAFRHIDCRQDVLYKMTGDKMLRGNGCRHDVFKINAWWQDV